VIDNHLDLSIVVPAFGEAPFLEETLHSILSTQEKSIPIYVIDDASPTNSIRELCANRFPTVKYIRNSENLGISGNFNKSISISQSKYVLVLGQDDILLTSLSIIFKPTQIGKNEIFAYMSKTQVYDSNSKSKFGIVDVAKKLVAPKTNRTYSGAQFRNRLLFGNWTYFPAIIWNKELLPEKPFREDLKYCMDFDLLLKMSFTPFKFYSSPFVAVGYRRHRQSTSMSAVPKERLQEELMVMTKHSTGSVRETIVCRLAIMQRMNFVVSVLKNTTSRLR